MQRLVENLNIFWKCVGEEALFCKQRKSKKLGNIFVSYFLIEGCEFCNCQSIFLM